ncbi:hypothetical protein BO71DRAFT_394935 [Aspergillus ellipticus CBS 707.79]|uniref:Uncharacterized protein n=1 Tax=Aspergillus ellipticus CBS 707.79 TaxID=1448320 RepID=A0A319F242_9EURO|nr:hypothetical protein BO71DRAFT_394935 [Aspergillus ellipticus CBS 707.79]
MEQLICEEGVSLEWTLHVEIDYQSDDNEAKPVEFLLPIKAPVVAIGRYFVTPEKKPEYQDTFDATKCHLEEFTAPYPLAGGWKTHQIPSGGDKKEDYVLFTG